MLVISSNLGEFNYIEIRQHSYSDQAVAITTEQMVSYLTEGKSPSVKNFKIRVLNNKDLTRVVEAIKVSTLISQVQIKIVRSRKTLDVINKVIDALRDKQTIINLKIKGWITPELMSRIMLTAATLPLIGITLDKIQEYEVFEPLYTIDTLKSLTLHKHHMDIEEYATFLKHILKSISILKLNWQLTTEEVDGLAKLLFAGAPLEILVLDAVSDTISIGVMLQANITLRSLVINEFGYHSAAPIFQGLIDNTNLIKFQGYCDQLSIPSLITMLKTNKTVEVLELEIVMGSSDQADLISALSHSSIIELALYVSDVTDGHQFMTTLLRALETNTVLKKLSLYIDDEDIELESEIIVDLLSRNQTLEALDLEVIEVVHPERLHTLLNNETLVQVNFGMPDILKFIADRNRQNRNRKQSTLLGLTLGR